MKAIKQTYKVLLTLLLIFTFGIFVTSTVKADNHTPTSTVVIGDTDNYDKVRWFFEEDPEDGRDFPVNVTLCKYEKVGGYDGKAKYGKPVVGYPMYLGVHPEYSGSSEIKYTGENGCATFETTGYYPWAKEEKVGNTDFKCRTDITQSFLRTEDGGKDRGLWISYTDISLENLAQYVFDLVMANKAICADEINELAGLINEPLNSQGEYLFEPDNFEWDAYKTWADTILDAHVPNADIYKLTSLEDALDKMFRSTFINEDVDYNALAKMNKDDSDNDDGGDDDDGESNSDDNDSSDNDSSDNDDNDSSDNSDDKDSSDNDSSDNDDAGDDDDSKSSDNDNDNDDNDGSASHKSNDKKMLADVGLNNKILIQVLVGLSIISATIILKKLAKK